MRRYPAHYKIVKDCLIDLCRCVAGTISEEQTKILIAGVVAPESSVRSALLQALESEIDLSGFTYSDELWIACHDDVEENSDLANTIWEANKLELPADAGSRMLSFLQSLDRPLRVASAKSLAEAVDSNPSSFESTVGELTSLYIEKAKPILPVYDEFGLQKKSNQRDPWESRSGIALAFKELAPLFEEEALPNFAAFLIKDGCLSDQSDTVRQEMIDAATTIFTLHGKAHVETIMKVFEQTLEAPDTKSVKQDRTNEAVIILYGTLAQHLDAEDARLPKVMSTLR